jgi:transposase-like protein
MTKTVRSRYTLEFKQEAVRLCNRGRAWRRFSAVWALLSRRCSTGSRPAVKVGSVVRTASR